MAKVEVRSGVVDPKQLSLERNIRGDFEDDDDFKELLANVRERLDQGEVPILQPITWYYKGGRAFVLLGHRRTRVCQMLGINIPGVKTDPPDESDRIICQLTENDSQFRKDIDPIAKANALRDAISLSNGTITQEILAKRMGKSKSWVSQHLALLKLPEDIQAMVADKQIQVAVAYDMTTKLSPEDIETHRDEVIRRATKRTQKESRTALTQFKNALEQIPSLFDGELPTPPDYKDAPVVPAVEPVDESIERLKGLFTIIKSMIVQAIEEAKEARIDIKIQLEHIIEIVNEEVE